MKTDAEIDEFLNELGKIWKKSPDKNFGNFIYSINLYVEHMMLKDPYYVTDDNLMQYIKQWYKEVKHEQENKDQ